MEYQPGDYFSSVHMNHLRRQSEGYGVMAGLDISLVTATLDIIVSTGTAIVGLFPSSSFKNATSSATLSMLSNDANPRKAVVYIDDGGTVSLLEGEASPAIPDGKIGRQTQFPFAPVIPSSSTLIAELWIPAGSSHGIDITVYQADKIGGSFWTVE
jgi:hypothetical protein